MRYIVSMRYAWIASFILICAVASQAIPVTVNYQGVVNSGSAPFDGQGRFRFVLVNENGTIQYWSNDGGNPPSTDLLVDVDNGLFNIALGDPNAMNTIDASIFNNVDVYLRTYFNDGVNGLQRLTPDQPLHTSPFAAKSHNSTLLNGQTDAYYLEWENITHMPGVFADGNDDDQPDNDAEVPDSISIDNSRLYAPAGTGNVGVGTRSPDDELDVAGMIRSDGLYIPNAPDRGVYLYHAASDGVYVYGCGNPNAHISSGLNNGVEIAGADGCGVYVGRAENDGLHVYSTEMDGVHICKAGDPSQTISSPTANAVEVEGAQGSGVFIGQTDADGIHICRVGNPSSKSPSTTHNGIEVEGAEGYGLYLGRTDSTGIVIESSGERGLSIVNAEADGIRIGSTVDYGIDINAAGYDGVSANTDFPNGYGLITNDRIFAGDGYYPSKSGIFAIHKGSQNLEPGDIVAISGGGSKRGFDDSGHIIHVDKVTAASRESVIGVVESRAFIDTRQIKTSGDDPETRRCVRLIDGDIAPGDYLAVTVFGPAIVKAEPDSEINPGNSIIASASGTARRSITQSINGLIVKENVGHIGKALEMPDKSGFLLVFVNCR